MEKTNKRITSFELLRVISIIMIVSYHYYVHGILHGFSTVSVIQEASGLNRGFALFLSPGGSVGVGIFFSITGYFVSKGKGLLSLKKTVIKVYVYGWLTIMSALAFNWFTNGIFFKEFQTEELIESLIGLIFVPFSSKMWWFATAYVLLIMLAPWLNAHLEHLSVKKMFVVVFMLLFFEYVLGRMVSPLFNYQTAVFFYLVGALLRKIHDLEVRGGGRLCWMLIVLFSWAICAFSNYYTLIRDQFFVRKFAEGISLVSSAVCVFFIVYMTIDIKLKKHKMINYLSASIFGVYLLHDSLFSRVIIWDYLIKAGEHYLSKTFIPYCIGSVLIIFILSIFIDKIIDKFVLKTIFKYFWREKA